jgi:hypothetical protein
MLSRDEYIEQAFFFRTMRERMVDNTPMQELLPVLREETLSTTDLPKAIDFMLAELLHCGMIASAMKQLGHYFTPFQAFVVTEAENDRGRFDLRVGLEILQREAEYLSKEPTRPGLFLYQFETLCRNRLRYDPGLLAISQVSFYDEPWRDWILTVRRQIGIIEFADLIYVRSEHYAGRPDRSQESPELAPEQVLFGLKEGRIALANRRKDSLLLLAALQRHLGYPAVPRQAPIDDRQSVAEQMARRLERLETRLKLIEEEQKGGIDITKFYAKDSSSEP